MICAQCGIIFDDDYYYESEDGELKFCSRECAVENTKRNYMTCQECNNTICDIANTCFDFNGNCFCSDGCMLNYNGITRVCSSEDDEEEDDDDESSDNKVIDELYDPYFDQYGV